VELTIPAAGVGDEVEAIVSLHQAASAVKLEAQAKSTYLSLTEATPLSSDGKSFGEPVTNDANRWQLDTTADGLTSIRYGGKLDWDGSRSVPVLRLRWQVTASLPASKLALPIQLTIVDRNGRATSEQIELTIVVLNDEPKIDDVTPKTFTSDVNTVLSIQGSNFQDTPKVYLVAGNEQIQLIEVQIIDPDPGTPFVQATVPTGTKPGTYKVRLVNPDESNTEYTGVEVVGASPPATRIFFLPVIFK
jgi:hypothetical protein